MVLEVNSENDDLSPIISDLFSAGINFVKELNMDLLNEKVVHRNYGDGKIIGFDGNTLEVQFACKVSKFVYPAAFDAFLTLNNAESTRRTAAERKQEIFGKLWGIYHALCLCLMWHSGKRKKHGGAYDCR